jgi:hypothetical protein
MRFHEGGFASQIALSASSVGNQNSKAVRSDDRCHPDSSNFSIPSILPTTTTALANEAGAATRMSPGDTSLEDTVDESRVMVTMTGGTSVAGLAGKSVSPPEGI